MIIGYWVACLVLCGLILQPYYKIGTNSYVAGKAWAGLIFGGVGLIYFPLEFWRDTRSPRTIKLDELGVSVPGRFFFLPNQSVTYGQMNSVQYDGKAKDPTAVLSTSRGSIKIKQRYLPSDEAMVEILNRLIDQLGDDRVNLWRGSDRISPNP